MIFSPPDRFPQLNERTITGSGKYELPQWSPDGRYLAYIDDADYQGHLTIYDTSTQQHHPLASGVLRFHMWKPDGTLTYLTLTRNVRGLFYDLRQVDVEGLKDEVLLSALPDVGNYSWISNQVVLILLGDENDDSFERSLYLIDITSGTQELLLSSQDLGFQFFSRLSLSFDKEILLIDGIGRDDGLPRALIVYNVETRSVLEQLVPENLFPINEIEYPRPSLGDDVNFGWVSNTDWILIKMNTPDGECYNYSLIFLDTEQLENSFCIPSVRGPFIDATISPDLTTLAFVTVVGPTETYLMLADVPGEFLDRLHE